MKLASKQSLIIVALFDAVTCTIPWYIKQFELCVVLRLIIIIFILLSTLFENISLSVKL